MPNDQRLEAAREWVMKRASYYIRQEGYLPAEARSLALLEYVVELEERLEKDKA